MHFENTFQVDAPIEQVWEALLDVERVAPCMPGAQVLERKGDDAYAVGIKVKVGPVSMQYRGGVEIVDRDADAHVARMRASAKETRGQGTASADIETRLSGNGSSTGATIVTELQVRGRAAGMGQGVMQDVASKLVETFAANLSHMLGSGQGSPEQATAARESAPAAAEPAAGAPPALAPVPVAAQPRPASAELSALSLAGGVIAGRLRDPRRLALALFGVGLIGYGLGRRRRS
jgi:carbon monoxide dehydrogenase subunit G